MCYKDIILVYGPDRRKCIILNCLEDKLWNEITPLFLSLSFVFPYLLVLCKADIIYIYICRVYPSSEYYPVMCKVVSLVTFYRRFQINNKNIIFSSAHAGAFTS